MEQSALLRVWTRIVSELALHQDQAPQEFSGQVVNPICESVCIQDTACAAKVFAVEYNRTGDENWLTRAKSALVSLKEINIYSGLPEPIWGVLNWHEEPESIVITERVFSAINETLRLIKQEYNQKKWAQLLVYLTSCLHGRGRFAHNTVKEGTKPGDVLNTTAIALYLLEYIAHNSSLYSHSIMSERIFAIDHLLQGQRSDGYWPYIYPGHLQQLGFRYAFIKHIPIICRYFCKGGDRSIFFGDFVHQCMVCYYLSKCFYFNQSKKLLKGVELGWNWIYKHLIKKHDEKIQIDWDWEPASYSPRFSNFRDTNSYFVILSMLPYLTHSHVVGEEAFQIAEGILAHINGQLLRAEGFYPCIVPHEGPKEILRNIFPCAEESVAWKGALLSELVLKLFNQ